MGRTQEFEVAAGELLRQESLRLLCQIQNEDIHIHVRVSVVHTIH